MTRDADGLDDSLRRAAGDEALDPRLQPVFHRLERLRTTPERNPQQVAAGRQAFLDRAAVPPVSQGSLSRQKSGHRDGRKELRPMSALAGLLVALALLFGGGGATALAAQDAMPTDWLYPFKLATEDVQLTLADGPAEQMELLGSWIDRRLQEMEQLTHSGEVVPLEAAHRLERQLGLALQTASQIGDPERVQAMLRLHVQLEAHLQTMQRLRLADPNGAALQSAEQAMIRTRAQIQGALQNPAAFRTRYGAGRPSDAPLQPSVPPAQSGASPTSEPSMAAPGAGQGPGAPGGNGPGDGDCLLCTPVPDGTVCPTCTPNLWLTPGPHGNGQGGGGR